MPSIKRLGKQAQDDGAPVSRTQQLRSVLRYDVPASIVVFLIALPLSVGIAIASGAPVLSGLISAVIGGDRGWTHRRSTTGGQRSREWDDGGHGRPRRPIWLAGNVFHHGRRRCPAARFRTHPHCASGTGDLACRRTHDAGRHRNHDRTSANARVAGWGVPHHILGKRC